jgi:hypothetical protein
MVGISKYGYEMRKEAEATKRSVTGKKILDKLLTRPKSTPPASLARNVTCSPACIPKKVQQIINKPSTSVFCPKRTN